jgi:hypothetical protein
MSETKTVRAIKPIDGQPAGTVLIVSPDMADFLIQGGAAEEVKSVAAKTVSIATESGNPKKTIQLNPDVEARPLEMMGAKLEKQPKESK